VVRVKNKFVFVVLVIFMLGAIVLGVLAKNHMVEMVSENRTFVDKYVANIDSSFVYEREEDNGDGTKSFYYTSSKYTTFVLVVCVKSNNGEYQLSDNFHSLTIQTEATKHLQSLVGEDKIFAITNSEELNVLPTVEEALLYNKFDCNVGILESEYDIDNLNRLKQILIDNKINCNVYFYCLTPAQFKEYSAGNFTVVENFKTYTMVIIENQKVVTEIVYE
jgi:hypothetical protein